MELEPGPFAVRDAMPFGPRVSREGLFTGLLDELAATLQGSDPQLELARQRVGDDLPQDLEATYASTVGDAADRTAAEQDGQDRSTAPALSEHGDQVERLRGSVLRFLPPPDVSLDTSFVDPPPVPRSFPPDPWRGGGGGDGKGSSGEPPAGPPRGEHLARLQVRQAYLDLLLREPDPGGWDYYTSQMVDNGLPIAWVRQQLQNSEEYRQLHTG